MACNHCVQPAEAKLIFTRFRYCHAPSAEVTSFVLPPMPLHANTVVL